MSSALDQAQLYFGYEPSLPLAITAILLYMAVSLPLFYQSYRSGNRLTYVLSMTALVECVGYVIRSTLVNNFSFGGYVLMDLLIILAPNALAFVNYKVLGKIIHSKSVHLHLPSSSSHLAAAHSSLLIDNARAPPTASAYRFHVPYLMDKNGEVHGERLASFFFLSDVLAICLQGAGGGMQGAGIVDLGTDVLLVGLSSQLAFFAAFTALSAYVRISPLYQQPELISCESRAQPSSTLVESEYKRAFIGLFATIALLYIRNIYRVIEFTMGYRGYLATTEAFMYAFDSLFILAAFILYVFFDFAAFLAKADMHMRAEMKDNVQAQGISDSNTVAP